MLDIKLAISYPTLGKPTMPHFSEVPNLPMTGLAPSDSQTFLFWEEFYCCLALTNLGYN